MNANWKKKEVQWSVFGLVLILGIVWISRSNRHETPESQIRKVVQILVEAAENHKLSPFKEYLSDQLKDQDGRSKQDILQTMQLLYLRHPSIHLQILSLDFSGSSDQIRNVNLQLLMSSSSFPEDRGSYGFVFRKEGQTWRIFSLDWGQGYGQE